MKSKVLKAVAVLSAVTVICIALLTVVNHFWNLSDEERFNRAVSSVMSADRFDVVYNYDDPSAEEKATEKYTVIADFNRENGAVNYLVNKVRIAVGGEYDGCYLIQSTGRGYKSAYVKMVVGYNKDGSVLGAKPMDIDKINDFAGRINWSVLSDKVKGKSGSVGSGSDLAAVTGATPVNTLNGAAEAINIANEFYTRVIAGVKETSEVVTDENVLSSLNSLFEVSESAYQGVTVSQFIRYPIRTAEADVLLGDVSGGKASVKNVYHGDGAYVILEVAGNYKDYGGWTLLVLLNSDNATAAAVAPYPTGQGYSVAGKWNASVLDSAEVMTSLFSGKSPAEITGMDNNLQGTTSVTQTNIGLKLTVYHALDIGGEVTQRLTDYIAEEGA